MKKFNPGRQYIFLDESGRPEILSAKGKNLVQEGLTSNYLILSAVVTQYPFKVQEEILKAKLEGIQSGSLRKHLSILNSLEVFHASSDTEPIREYVFQCLSAISEFKALVLVAEKQKAYEGFQSDREGFYNAMCGQLLKRLLHLHEESFIVISRKDSNLGIQKNLNVEVDRLRLEFFEAHGISLKAKVNFEHNPHYSHSALQIADYVAWAVFKLFEQGERKYFDIIKNNISFIHDIFNKKIYTKENPL